MTIFIIRTLMFFAPTQKCMDEALTTTMLALQEMAMALVEDGGKSLLQIRRANPCSPVHMEDYRANDLPNG